MDLICFSFETHNTICPWHGSHVYGKDRIILHALYVLELWNSNSCSYSNHILYSHTPFCKLVVKFKLWNIIPSCLSLKIYLQASVRVFLWTSYELYVSIKTSMCPILIMKYETFACGQSLAKCYKWPLEDGEIAAGVHEKERKTSLEIGKTACWGIYNWQWQESVIQAQRSTRGWSKFGEERAQGTAASFKIFVTKNF